LITSHFEGTANATTNTDAEAVAPSSTSIFIVTLGVSCALERFVIDGLYVDGATGESLEVKGQKIRYKSKRTDTEFDLGPAFEIAFADGQKYSLQFEARAVVSQGSNGIRQRFVRMP
jgi:hypothetical protein